MIAGSVGILILKYLYFVNVGVSEVMMVYIMMNVSTINVDSKRRESKASIDEK